MDDVPAWNPSFLGIPIQIRNQIYRHLLLESRPIGYPSGARFGRDDFGWANPLNEREENGPNLWPDIFENTFALVVTDSKHAADGESAMFDPYTYHIADSKHRGKPVQRMERFLIKVNVTRDEVFRIVKSSLLRVCDVLSQNPKLRQLDIFLEDDHCMVERSVVRVLEPFTILRGIDVVEFHRVPPTYARYLQAVMTKGPQSLEEMPKRYFKLQQRIGWDNRFEKTMRKAMEALERNLTCMFDTHCLSVECFEAEKKTETESEEKVKEESKSEAVEKWIENLEGGILETVERQWNSRLEEEEDVECKESEN